MDAGSASSDRAWHRRCASATGSWPIESPDAFPYRLAAHYYARGPEGLGLGTIQIVGHDGRGHLTIEDRPFALQIDDGMIDLGIVTR